MAIHIKKGSMDDIDYSQEKIDGTLHMGVTELRDNFIGELQDNLKEPCKNCPWVLTFKKLGIVPTASSFFEGAICHSTVKNISEDYNVYNLCVPKNEETNKASYCKGYLKHKEGRLV